MSSANSEPTETNLASANPAKPVAELTDEIERGVSSAASVASGLGYPVNRFEVSRQPTGWQATRLTEQGTADQSLAVVEKI